MLYIMNEIILEFNKIFKYEKAITKDECYKYTSDECCNYIEKSNKVLFIINAEYEAPEEESTINYYNQYWGKKQFNELLEKYKLKYEWFDTCIYLYIMMMFHN